VDPLIAVDPDPAGVPCPADRDGVWPVHVWT
jgi:hypothetical protein